MQLSFQWPNIFGYKNLILWWRVRNVVINLKWNSALNYITLWRCLSESGFSILIRISKCLHLSVDRACNSKRLWLRFLSLMICCNTSPLISLFMPVKARLGSTQTYWMYPWDINCVLTGISFLKWPALVFFT